MVAQDTSHDKLINKGVTSSCLVEQWHTIDAAQAILFPVCVLNYSELPIFCSYAVRVYTVPHAVTLVC
jgi:hypothetical protein